MCGAQIPKGCPPSRSESRAGERGDLTSRGASLGHGLGLGPYRALDDLKLDLVAFIQGTKPRAGNRRLVDEYVRTILRVIITFGVVLALAVAG